MKYTIDRDNGESYTASSMSAAIAQARRVLCATRVYRGAEYQTDRPTRGGERQYCTGLDIWRTRADATKQSSACAPIVISWRTK